MQSLLPAAARGTATQRLFVVWDGGYLRPAQPDYKQKALFLWLSRLVLEHPRLVEQPDFLLARGQVQLLVGWGRRRRVGKQLVQAFDLGLDDDDIEAHHGQAEEE